MRILSTLPRCPPTRAVVKVHGSRQPPPPPPPAGTSGDIAAHLSGAKEGAWGGAGGCDGFDGDGLAGFPAEQLDQGAEHFGGVGVQAGGPGDWTPLLA